jgi:hypothetical protein
VSDRLGAHAKNSDKPKAYSGLRRGFTIGILAFAVAIILTGPVSSLLQKMGLFDGLLMLTAVIGFAILADVLAIAATSADETPFNAMAAKKIPGAREGLDLIRKASLVNSLCADVIGDITGTISGVIATTVIISVTQEFPWLPAPFATTLSVGLIAFFTVGGKAAEKGFAVKASTRVVLFAGKAIYYTKQVAAALVQKGGHLFGLLHRR